MPPGDRIIISTARQFSRNSEPKTKHGCDVNIK
jgi:hypothetical protein